MPKELTQEYLKECVDYNPDTGIFTWRYRPESHFMDVRAGNSWNGKYCGIIAGHRQTMPSGYRYVEIRICGVSYRASRLAWMYMSGTWPIKEIDHIDHDGWNNSFDNLRCVTRKINMKNLALAKTNTSGVTGVYWHKLGKKWHVSICADGNRINGGLFTSFEEAVIRRKELDREYNFHPNHGCSKA